jgi:transposase
MDGCGVLTAAKIAGEVGNVTRFRNEAALARYIGVAPLPHASGSTAGHTRASRAGNRNLNAALHRIALIKIRQGGPGRPYYLKRQESGDPAMAALRCLKRRLVRVIFNRMQINHRMRANAACE